MDDFYEPLINSTDTNSGIAHWVFETVLSAPVTVSITFALLPLLIFCITRLLSGHDSEIVGDGDDSFRRSVWLLPYWIPIIGHGFKFLSDPMQLMDKARDQSQYGIFSLNLGATTHNIVSDPFLVKGVLQQKESIVSFEPIARTVIKKFFGIPDSAKHKYAAAWLELNHYFGYLMKEPHLSDMLGRTIGHLEQYVPKMISFAESEIDQQPWERWAKASYISNSETEVNLMAMIRDVLGHASIPGVFGKALLDKYPDLLHDIYAMDIGMYYFLMALPAWTPWPGVNKAHRARRGVWRAMDDFQRALDAHVDGKPDFMWGDLDDVSAFILGRHEVFRKYNFGIKERGDITVIWALIVNSNLLVYWQLLHILATPGLVERIRSEVAPYVQIEKPYAIGSFSEAPKLKLSSEELAKGCPLLKSTYLEALRMSAQPWSVRDVATDFVIPGDKRTSSPSFQIRKGQYITIPHDLHMRDPKYFKDPLRFDPERFLVKKDDGTLTTDIGTMRPYGGGPSMCKGRIFAERECLSLVAAVLMFWDIEPADKTTGWTIPRQQKTSAVSLPVKDTRVRFRRRHFEWDL
ncbi:cytochrome P450 [Bisporella sp. PMI_857]|nr:cytochrome P450 [Bisporella sp. PMI_857]